MLYIQKKGLPPALHNRLFRIAAFPNPEFYKAQAMHLSTYGKPPIISCAEEHPQHIALPRGCLNDVRQLLGELDVSLKIEDKRSQGKPIKASFTGKLRTTNPAAKTGILNYFIHRITSGSIEGTVNKIKTLKRQAYGFRDMVYFKLRLYYLHCQGYSLTG